MNEGKTMCLKNMWHKAAVAIVVLVVFVMIMPMTVFAEDVTTGTIGDNGGITWTYDAETETLTLTGEDSGLQGERSNPEYVSIFKDMTNGNIKHVVMEDCTIKGSAQGMFASLSDVESIDFKNVDTSNVTAMDYMFSRCTGLKSVDLSGFDTSNVNNMRYMFFECRSLTELDVTGFDTSNVYNMERMFSCCIGLTELDLSNFDTSNVSDMMGMFGNSSSLESIDVSSFDTSRVNYMYAMFASCRSLKSIDVSGFKTHNVQYLDYMFADCSSLIDLDVSGFDTSSATIMSSMFEGCSSLTSLDLSGFNTLNVKSPMEGYTGLDKVLSKCSKLKTLSTPKIMEPSQKIELPRTFCTEDGKTTTELKSEFCNMMLLAENPFADVDEKSWQYTFVKYALDNNLMSGKGKDAVGNIIFDPDNNMTRAEFVQTLYNKENKPDIAFSDLFNDVKSTDWFAKAILWASQNAIVTGKGDIFDVSGNVTRQEIAVILYKYAKYLEYDVAGSVDLSPYADDEKIASWAQSAMEWAISKGIMKGKGSGDDLSTYKLDPTGDATRAECATMLKNFIEAFNK